MVPNRSIVFHPWSLHKSVVEIREELHTEQKQSQSGQRDAGWESLIAHFVSVGIAHLTGSHFKGVEQALFHTVAEEQWVYTILFILIFLLSYIMGTVKKWSMSFFLCFKAVDECGVYNMKRFSAFPRARYNASRRCASFHMQSCQCTFRLDLQPFCRASLRLLWAYHQLLRGDLCLCTCAYDKRCGDFLIWSYIYSEPGLEWDTDSPWSRNLLGAEMWLTCYPAYIIGVCILLWFSLTPLSHYYTGLNCVD